MKRFPLFLLTLLNTLNYLDRYLVAALLTPISAHLMLNNEQGGKLASSFVFGYFIFSPIFGFLGDRWSRPKLMALGVMIWSLATMAGALAPTFWIFVAARVMVGVGEASFGTISPGYLKDHIRDPIKLNSALSIFFAAIPVGSALGYVTGGFFAAHYDWQTAFFAGGVPGLILMCVLFFMKDAERSGDKPPPLGPGLKKIAAEPILWFAIGGYVFNAFALNGIATFIVKYGGELGFDVATINQYFGLILVVSGLVGTIVGGKLASRYAAGTPDPRVRLFRFTAVGAAISLPFLAAAFLVNDKNLFLLLCFVAELTIFSGVAPINAIIVLTSPDRLETLTQGVTIFALNLLGSCLAPVIVGRTADHYSLAIGLQLSTVAIGFSALLWYLGERSAASRHAKLQPVG